MGGSLQVTEQVKNGSLDFALTDDSVLGSFYKPMLAFQIPYLFPSSPVAWEFMNSKFMRDMTEDMRKAPASARWRSPRTASATSPTTSAR